MTIFYKDLGGMAPLAPPGYAYGYNHLDAFYVTCFARVCEIFTAVVGELQRGPHIVLQSLYAATHII